jgi:hypothetical protein
MFDCRDGAMTKDDEARVNVSTAKNFDNLCKAVATSVPYSSIRRLIKTRYCNFLSCKLCCCELEFLEADPSS